MNVKPILVLLMCAEVLHAQDFWQSVLPSVPYVLNIAANSQDHLFTTSGAGVYRSTDGGATWVQSNAGLSGPYATGLAVNPLNDDLYVSSAPRIFRSTNEGEIWVVQDSTTFPDGAWRLVSNGQGILFASSDTLRRSSDGGRSWTAMHNGLPYGFMQDLRVHSGGNIYVARHNDWIFRSTNNGDSWTTLPAPIGLPFFDPDAIAFGSAGEIYVGDDGGGFFQSTDGGSSWLQLNSGLPSTFVWALAVTDGGHVFAGMANGGVYHSTTGGVQWDSINSGLDPSSRRIYSLFVASSGYVFAGTVNGLYRSSQPVTAVGEDVTDLAAQHSLSQNYPNPFNPTTTLQFTIVNRQSTIVKVYDVLGRDIATLVNDVKEPGVYTVEWDASGVSSGVYFYRLQAGTSVQTKRMMLVR